MAHQNATLALALCAGIVMLTGLFFVAAGIARLGAISGLIAKPVLRGFALGLALTIVLKQLPAVLGFQALHGDFPGLAWEVIQRWRAWNPAGAVMALVALAFLRTVVRWPLVPGALLVLAIGIALDLGGYSQYWGVASIGSFALSFSSPTVPDLARAQWLSLIKLAIAMALILYAESYGSIRTFAMRHGDSVSSNRDLVALGVANLASALFQGMPVGAGYSATSANDAAGAQSRAAGLMAGGVVLLAVLTVLPWIGHTPQPLLGAIVINAVSHSLNPAALRPYFRWRRDRLIVLVAIAAVVLLGVLDGLLVAIGVSLALLLRSLSRSRVSWLGRLDQSHDYVDTARHPHATVPEGMVIARPEEPVFFGNADAVFTAVRLHVQSIAPLRRIVLSLEESPNLDATSIEALCDFALWTRQRDIELVLARVKDAVRDVLAQVNSTDLPATSYAPWSVDDAVRHTV